MALLLSALEEKKSWQPVYVKLPASSGFVDMNFRAEFFLVDDEEFERTIREKTVKECLDIWLVDVKEIQEDKDNKKDMTFDDDLKEKLTKSNLIRASLWESYQNARSGGRLKN